MIALPVSKAQGPAAHLGYSVHVLRRKFDIGHIAAGMRFEKTDLWTANKTKWFQAEQKSKFNDTLTTSGKLDQRPPLKTLHNWGVKIHWEKARNTL